MDPGGNNKLRERYRSEPATSSAEAVCGSEWRLCSPSSLSRRQAVAAAAPEVSESSFADREISENPRHFSARAHGFSRSGPGTPNRRRGCVVRAWESPSASLAAAALEEP